MNKKKNNIQGAGAVECGRVIPMCAIVLLPVMIIFVEEKLKLL